LRKETNSKKLEQALDSSLKAPFTTYVFRLQLLILLQHQTPIKTISSILGCDSKTILKWKKRFDAGKSILDKPRSGRKLIIPPEVNQRLMGFYCQHEPLPGYSRWTIRDAEKYIKTHPEVLDCTINRSSIHRILRSKSLKPYRVKYFLQISDPDFFPKMEKIINVYQKNYKNLFCLDECTGLQALERIAPRLPANGNCPEYIEPEYIRHGTVSVLSILHVATGNVFTECIPDHKSSTIALSLKKHILRFDKNSELHYICDNYSSHSTALICDLIAELCSITLPKLETVEERRQWLESSEKRIIFHFLPKHGSWLNLIENWFGILQKKALKNESFTSKEELENRIMNFSNTWNTEFSHPFNFSYTGEGLHEKVIGRFIRWIQIEASQFSAKLFEKQCKLILNLADFYWTKVKKNIWENLQKTLTVNTNYIDGIIGKDKEIVALFMNVIETLNRKLKVS